MDTAAALLSLSTDQAGQYFASVYEGLTEQGWSGDWTNFANGNADVELVPGESGSSSEGALTLATSRGGEISVSKLDAE
eukprot:5003099-Pyramimonas_sp.AAC.1